MLGAPALASRFPSALLPTFRAWLRHHVPALFLLGAVVLAVFQPVFPPSQWRSHIHWGDALINCYLTNWGQEVLWREPWTFYDSPIFYPQRHSGAFTDTYPLLCLLTSPLRLFGNPLLSYNLSMLAAVLFSGISMYFFLYSLAGHRRAALIGAVIFSCNGDMLWHLAGHPGIVSAFCIPGVFGFYLAFRRSRRILPAIFCGVFLLGGFFCSWYLGFIALVGLGVLWGVDLLSALLRVGTRELLLVLVVAGAVGLAFWASSPYRDVSVRFGNSRNLHDAARGSADPVEYFLPPRIPNRSQTLMGRWIGKWVSWPPRLENTQFYGYSVYAVAVVALAVAVGRLARRRTSADDRLLLRLAVVGMAGLILSWGPYLWIGPRMTPLPLPFRAIYEYLPPLRFIRSPARFAVLVALAVATATALWLARSSWFNRPRRWVRAGVGVTILGVLVFEYRPVSAPPLRRWDFSAYEVLKNFGDVRRVVSFPFNHNDFLVDSTGTFPTTPSGYIGGVLNYHYETLNSWMDSPTSVSLALLAALDVKAAAVYGESRKKLVENSSAFALLGAWPGGGLYRFDYTADAEIAKARELLAGIPERPPIIRRTDFPPSTPSTRALRTSDSPDQPPYHIEYTYRGLFHPFVLSGGDLPLREAGHIYVKMALRDLGADYSISKIYWTTRQDSQWNEAKSCVAYFVADGSLQVLEFDLTGVAAWRKGGTLQSLRFDFSAKPYPGQTLRVDEIRLAP